MADRAHNLLTTQAMRVRARRNNVDGAPEAIASLYGPGVKPAITIDKEYEVLALVQFGAGALLQIVGDHDWPIWEPSWCFEIVDPMLPADWICSMLSEDRWIALGPEFVVKDTESYERMVELEPEPVTMFWERVTRIEETRQVVTRLVEILRRITAELEPYSGGDSRGPGAVAAARWREKLTTLASTLEARKSQLDPAQRAHLSNTFFDAPDSLLTFSFDEQEFPDASRINTCLTELVATLYEAMA